MDSKAGFWGPEGPGLFLGVRSSEDGTKGKWGHLGKGEDSQGYPGDPRASPAVWDKQCQRADARSESVPNMDGILRAETPWSAGRKGCTWKSK